jgi:hypothetical protein
VKYALFDRPTLCLTDLATYQDPAYKSGNACWGGASGPIAVMDEVGTPGLPAGSTAIEVDLSRGLSPCPFTAGVWNAELNLEPRTDGGGMNAYIIRTSFQVGAAVAETAPPPSGTVPSGSACLASMVSP